MTTLNTSNHIPSLQMMALDAFTDNLRSNDPMLFQALCSKKFRSDEPSPLVNANRILTQTIAKHTRNAQELLKALGSELEDHSLRDIVEGTYYLRHISISIPTVQPQDQRITDLGLSALTQCHCLRSISLDFRYFDNSNSIHGISIKDISLANPQIKSLNLMGLNQLKEDCLIATFASLPILERLKLGWGTPATDGMMEALCEHKSITHLSLLNGKSLTAKGIEHLVELPKLEELTLEYANNITPKGFSHFLEKASVKSLTLKNTIVRDEMFTTLPEGFKSKLTVLILGQCNKLTKAAVEKISKHFPYLKKLRFNHSCSHNLRRTIGKYYAAGKFPHVKTLVIGHAG